MLQPTMQQQQQKQQEMMSNREITSLQHNNLSPPSSRIRTRFLGASNRRMGVVLDSSGSPAVINHQRHESASRNRARDVSWDPALIRGLLRHDRKTRIYDRVAEDLLSDNIEHADRRLDKHSGTVFNGKLSSSEHFHVNNTSLSSLIRS